MAAAWRAWLAHEKRQAPATVKAYQTDLRGFLGVLRRASGRPAGPRPAGRPRRGRLSRLARLAPPARASPGPRPRGRWPRCAASTAISTASTAATTPRSRRCARRAWPSGCRGRCRAGQARELIEQVAEGASPDWVASARSRAAAAALRRGPADRRGAGAGARRARPRARRASRRSRSPARAASSAWCRSCRWSPRRSRPISMPARTRSAPSAPLFVGLRGKRLQPALVRRRMRRSAAPAGAARERHAACAAPQLRDPSAGRRRRSAGDPGAARATPACRPPRAIPGSRASA